MSEGKPEPAGGDEALMDAIVKSIQENTQGAREQFLWSMHPQWLEYSINKSLSKLNIESLDCVYLSAPLEMGMRLHQDPELLFAQLGKAFAFLEELVQDGKIGCYGIQFDKLMQFDPELQGQAEGR